MFIPGQVRMNKVLAFMESYKGKTQVVEGKQSEAPAVSKPVQEVTYSKPETADSNAIVNTGKATTRSRTTKTPAVRRSKYNRTVTL
jgi:hypothetical protein